MAFGRIRVVNWNGERFLKDCLSAPSDQSYVNHAKIILVDNGSSGEVKKGRSIMITERGKIIATIVPAQEHKVQSDMNPLSLLRVWVLLLALLVIFACGDSSPKLPLARLKVEFGRHNIPAEMMVAETVSADVTVKNASTKIWPSSLTKREGMR